MSLISGGGGSGGGLPLTGGTLTGPLLIDYSAGSGNEIPLQIKASYNAQNVDFVSVYNTDHNLDLVNVDSGGSYTVNDAVTGAARASVNFLGGVVANAGFTNNIIRSGALPTVSPVSGTAFQARTSDAFLVVPVTFNPTAGAAATCKVELSPDNVTYSIVGTETEPAGIAFDGTIHLISLFVPAAWYIKLTVVNATLGTGTYY